MYSSSQPGIPQTLFQREERREGRGGKERRVEGRRRKEGEEGGREKRRKGE